MSFVTDAYAVAIQRAREAPGTLTAPDFEALEAVNVRKAAEARAQHAAALSPATPPALGPRTSMSADDLAEMILFGARSVMGPLRDRVAALEAQLAALDVGPTLTYRGVWKEGVSYPPQTAITASGSLWIAMNTTNEKPGNGATDWILAVKRGQDGRDGR